MSECRRWTVAHILVSLHVLVRTERGTRILVNLVDNFKTELLYKIAISHVLQDVRKKE